MCRMTCATRSVLHHRHAPPPASCLLRVAALLGLGAIVSSEAGAQSPRVRAVVRDSAAGHPVPYANVEIDGTRRVIADDSGRVEFEVRAPQRLTLDVRRIGFRPVKVSLDVRADTSIDVILAPIAQALAGAVIRGNQPRLSLETSGFYQRVRDREKGILMGHFLTEEDIERRRPYRITQMLENIPSVRVIPINTADGKIIERAGARSDVTKTPCLSDHDPACRVPVGKNNCPMTVYVDGRRLNRLGAVPGFNFAFGIDELAAPAAVAGIEVYSSPLRIPPQYQPLAGTCGAILIWTK